MSVAIKLPPSQRDFEVYHFLNEGGSTRSAAMRFGVSQTRVRQLARRVVTWAAEVLPPDTEAETAGLLRVAVSVAGDRLDFFYQQTMEQWHATHQVKFLGLAIRITQATARLPSRSCEIDAAAADLLEGPEVENLESETGSQKPVSEESIAATPPVGDCSPNRAMRVSTAQPFAVHRDATPQPSSKLGLLLKEGPSDQQQLAARVRTLLTPPNEDQFARLGMTPAELGVNVDDILHRRAPRKPRAK